MARIRTIKPEFFQDEKLAPLPPATRLVFLGLILMADDAGRLLDNLKVIDAFIFPETDDTARQALNELAALGRIKRGFTDSNQAVIEITNWLSHQKIAHPSPYTLAALTRHSREPHEILVPLPTTTTTTTTTTREDRELETPPALPVVRTTNPKGGDLPPDFVAAWEAYPKRPNNSKVEALRAWQARVAEGVRADEMLDGVRRYATYCAVSHVEGRFIKQASTFFGPDHHWESDYTPDAPKPTADDAYYAMLVAEAADMSQWSRA